MAIVEDFYRGLYFKVIIKINKKDVFKVHLFVNLGGNDNSRKRLYKS